MCDTEVNHSSAINSSKKFGWSYIWISFSSFIKSCKQAYSKLVLINIPLIEYNMQDYFQTWKKKKNNIRY